MNADSTRFRFMLRLALGFASMLGLSLWLLMLVRQNYAGKLMAQTWPAGMPSPAFIQPNKPDAPLLVLLGDSRMVDWGLPELEGYRVANWAVNGSSSAQAVLRCRDMLARAKPHTVVVQIGVNDLKLLGIKPELSGEVIATVASNTLAIVQDCRHARARVVLLPVWPTGRVDWRRRAVWSEAIEPARLKLNARVRTQAAALEDVRIIDLFEALPPPRPESDKTDWFRDTLHLKPMAYAPLTKRLSDGLPGRDGWRGSR